MSGTFSDSDLHVESKKARDRIFAKFCILAGTRCNTTCILCSGELTDCFYAHVDSNSNWGRPGQCESHRGLIALYTVAKVPFGSSFDRLIRLQDGRLEFLLVTRSKIKRIRSSKEQASTTKTAIEIEQSSKTFTKHRILRPGPTSLMSNRYYCRTSAARMALC